MNRQIVAILFLCLLSVQTQAQQGSLKTTAEKQVKPREPIAVSFRMLESINKPQLSKPSSRLAQATNSSNRLTESIEALPQVGVHTQGPETLVVNKEADYVISVVNMGVSEAKGVRVECELPSWVELKKHEQIRGSVKQNASSVVWEIPTLSVQEQLDLTLSLVPRQGKAFELNVDIAVKPANVQRRITVQQPELALDLKGPKSIRFRDGVTWSLLLSNPGTGALEDLEFDVFAGDQKVATQRVGRLGPGAAQPVALQIRPKEAGVHAVRVVGRAGDISEVAEAEINVRQGKLQLEVDGTRREFAGAPLNYTVTVRNTGDDDVENVLLALQIPDGMEYLEGLPKADVTERSVSWVVNRIGVEEELKFPLKLAATKGGQHPVEVVATTMDRMTAKHKFVTQSFTAPDLRLIVTDPVGPRPMKDIAEYEIRVINHGTDVAKEISVVAVCDETLEPVDVTGSAVIKEGRIYFKPTEVLEPDHAMVYKVKVRPLKIGVHDFKVIVKSVVPESRLAAQETTQFFDSTTLQPSDVADAAERWDLNLEATEALLQEASRKSTRRE